MQKKNIFKLHCPKQPPKKTKQTKLTSPAAPALWPSNELPSSGCRGYRSPVAERWSKVEGSYGWRKRGQTAGFKSVCCFCFQFLDAFLKCLMVFEGFWKSKERPKGNDSKTKGPLKDFERKTSKKLLETK